MALHVFCGCNCKTSKICHEKTRFSLSEQGSNWQHQMRLASLYPWHIMTSALHHDKQRIFNLLPYFVKICWISTSSATTGKNLKQIDHHLSELWKKKGSFLWNTMYILDATDANNWQEISANAHNMRESLWQFQFISSAENRGAHAKLIYKYQILYLDRITIIVRRHLVNDTDLWSSPKSPRNP